MNWCLLQAIILHDKWVNLAHIYCTALILTLQTALSTAPIVHSVAMDCVAWINGSAFYSTDSRLNAGAIDFTELPGTASTGNQTDQTFQVLSPSITDFQCGPLLKGTFQCAALTFQTLICKCQLKLCQCNEKVCSRCQCHQPELICSKALRLNTWQKKKFAGALDSCFPFKQWTTEY